MRITMLAFGTRGDVTPLVALGSRLRSDGHRVTFATHGDFASLVRQHGLEFHSLPGSYQDLLASKEGRHALGVPRNSLLGLRGLFRPFRDCAEAAYNECWQASVNADALICSALAAPAADLIARARDLPLVVGQPIPAVPSGLLPHPSFPSWPLGPAYNRLTHAVGFELIRRSASDVLTRWAHEARRLSPAGERPLRKTVMVAVSPIVLPRPDDWPDNVHLTGYWFLPKTGTADVPDDLRAFMDAGPKPICLGFGSMADDEPEQLKALVLDAIRRLKTRAVIVTGSGGALDGFARRDDVCEVKFADYDWLFSRVSAVVHQGGTGTASFCLTAGTPQVIVPYCLDHMFWSWRMRAIGVAPAGVRRHRLTAPALSAAIQRAVDDESFARRARALAPSIRAEDGVGRAVSILNRTVSAGVDGLLAPI